MHGSISLAFQDIKKAANRHGLFYPENKKTVAARRGCHGYNFYINAGQTRSANLSPPSLFHQRQFLQTLLIIISFPLFVAF